MYQGIPPGLCIHGLPSTVQICERGLIFSWLRSKLGLIEDGDLLPNTAGLEESWDLNPDLPDSNTMLVPCPAFRHGSSALWPLRPPHGI